jgi:hypothetical protein
VTAAGLAAGLALVTAGCGGGSNNNAGTGGHGGQIGGSGGGSGGSTPSDGSMSDTTSEVPLGTALSFPFTTDAEGFAVDTFSNPGPYTDGNPQNLGGAMDASAHPTAAFDGSTGMPTAGSLVMTATFTDFNQTLNVRKVYPNSGTINLAGKIVTAQIRLDTGSTFSGTVHLMALSSPSPPKPAPGYFFAQGNSILLQDNNWHTLTFDLSSPEFAAAGFDSTDIVQLGVQLASGLMAVGADGSLAASYGPPQSVSLHFVSVATN